MQEQGLGAGHDDGAERRSEDVAAPGQHGLAAPAHEEDDVTSQTAATGETIEATPPHAGAVGAAGAANVDTSAESSRREIEAGSAGDAGAASGDVQEAEETAAALSPTEFASPASEDKPVHPASEDWQVSQEQPGTQDDPPASQFDAAGPPVAPDPSQSGVSTRQETEVPSGSLAEAQAVRLYRSGTDATPPDVHAADRQEAADVTEGRLSQPGHYEAQQVVVPPQPEAPAEVVAPVPDAEQETIAPLAGATSGQDRVAAVTVREEEPTASSGHDQAMATLVEQDDTTLGQTDTAAPGPTIAEEGQNAEKVSPAVPVAPRREAAPPLRSLADLSDGQVITGRVKSLAAFGAFVDLGLRERKDGLIHVSQLADRRIGHPSEVVQVGQEVTVRVVSVDRERGRVGLSLRGAEEPQDVPSSYRAAPVEAPAVQDEVTMQSLLARYSRPSADSQLPPQRGSRRADRDRQEREELLRRLREESNQS